MAAIDLLAENRDPSEEAIRKGLSGNTCRCTGYVSIIAAVKDAAEELRKAAA
jgi:carbon-monoxide dehydrogenase small subunit